MQTQRVKNPVDLPTPQTSKGRLRRIPITVIKEDQETDNFLGIGKKAQARKKERVAIRNEKKRAKIDDRSYKKRAKADSLAKRYSGKATAGIIAAEGEAAANMALAQQGIVGNPVSQQPDIASQALGVAGGLLGGGGQQQYEDQVYEDQLNESSLGQYKDNLNPDGSPKKNNTILYVIIGVVVIAGFMYFKKK